MTEIITGVDPSGLTGAGFAASIPIQPPDALRDLLFLEFGHTVLHSGQHTDVKIVVEKLREVPYWGYACPSEWLPSPVVGVPTGGAWLAEKMQAYKDGSGPIVVVEDVWTTGASVRQFIKEQGIENPLVWVMFLRGELPPISDFPFFSYYCDARNLPLWAAEHCPYCEAARSWLKAVQEIRKS